MLQKIGKLEESSNRSLEAHIRQNSFYTPLDIIEKEAQNAVFKNLFLTWAGCYIKAYGHLVKNRLLQDHVLIYCVDGQGWLELAGKSWSIKKGDLFVCPSGIPHTYGAKDNDPWTKYWLHFRGASANEFISLLGITATSPILPIGENTKILSWLQDIFKILSKGYTQSNLLFATSYLMNILCYINSLSVNQNLIKAEHMDLEKVVGYMLDNLNSTLSLEQLSAFAGVSRYHLVRIFRRKVGYTPMDYFIRLKIQKACELLEASNIKINSISAALGFSNQYYFSTTFKRIIGQSPESYRAMLR